MFLYYFNLIMKSLDPKIWGPQYWFVLYSICLTYPQTPNNVAKKKYYDFFQNLPLFIPHDDICSNFSKLLDKYPVTPYLDSRDALLRWLHFIHNRINIVLNKNEISFREAMENYYNFYAPTELTEEEKKNTRRKYIYFICILILILTIIVIYNL